MEITAEQYDKIKGVLPVQRGNVEVENMTFLNALLYITENGCKWRALPERFGKWNTIYRRVNRWAKKGIIEKLFEKMQKEQIMAIKVDFIAIDSTSVKVHPDACGAVKKTGLRLLASHAAAGRQRFIWLPLMIDVL
jgi:transposase